MSQKPVYSHEKSSNDQSIGSLISNIIVLLGICGFIVIAIVQGTKDHWYYTNTAEATYEGFIQHEERTYPIVEIDGVEYVSKIHQPIRDNTFVGKPVQVKYNKTFDDFKIAWDA